MGLVGSVLSYYTSGSIIELLIRYFVLVTIILLLINYQMTIYKLTLYAKSIHFMIMTKDKKYRKPSCGPFNAPTDATVFRRTVIFIRHGESTWNETFNRGYNPLFFIPRLLLAVAHEYYLLVTGQRDSWFYDSPLSHLGIEQAEKLHKYIVGTNVDNLPSQEEQALVLLLRGDRRSDTAIVSSNLRRALSTVCLCLHDRLEKNPTDVVKILPQLQEISRNPDTLSLTPARTKPIPSWIENGRQQVNMRKFYTAMDVTEYSGNKSVKITGLTRLQGFADWCFKKNTHENVIVAGHSLWFREFFRVFLPDNFNHDAKNKKIANGGAISFHLYSVTLNNSKIAQYVVDPSSIRIIYGGFSAR